MAHPKGIVLGAREEEVGLLIAQGLSNEDIAARRGNARAQPAEQAWGELADADRGVVLGTTPGLAKPRT